MASESMIHAEGLTKAIRRHGRLGRVSILDVPAGSIWACSVPTAPEDDRGADSDDAPRCPTRATPAVAGYERRQPGRARAPQHRRDRSRRDGRRTPHRAARTSS